MKEAFITYIHYLVHPFRSHQALIEGDRDFLPEDISIYESLGISWVFIILSSFFKVIIISFLLSLFVGVMDPATDLLQQFYTGDRYTGFYFIILSAILDVVFFPLVNLFLIQFWDIIIKSFSHLAGVDKDEDIDLKSKHILSVALSSNILLVIPVIGAMAQKVAEVVQMYAGLRTQLKFSPLASIFILLTPYFILVGFICMILAVFILTKL